MAQGTRVSSLGGLLESRPGHLGSYLQWNITGTPQDQCTESWGEKGVLGGCVVLSRCRGPTHMAYSVIIQQKRQTSPGDYRKQTAETTLRAELGFRQASKTRVCVTCKVVHDMTRLSPGALNR